MGLQVEIEYEYNSRFWQTSDVSEALAIYIGFR